MMDCGPQESEATALTSESQPLLKSSAEKCKNIRPRNAKNWPGNVATFGREMLINSAGKCCKVRLRNVAKLLGQLIS